MAYPVISTIKEVNASTPADADAASTMAEAVRQVKAFLKAYLAVAHTDNGELRSGSVGASQVIENSIPMTALAGSLLGSQLAPQAIQDWHMDTNSVVTGAIQDGAVTSAKLGALAVALGKIDEDAVTGTEIADNSILKAHMTDNSVGNAEISDVSGSKLTEGSVAATKLEADATLGANLGLYVGTSTASGNKLCKIGGAVTATIVAGSPDVLTFAFASGAASSSGVAVFYQNVSGTMGTAYADRTGPWVRVSGETVASPVGNTIKVLEAGTYLIHYAGSGYSCDEHQTQLLLGAGVVATGSVAFAPAGSQSQSSGWATLSLNVDDLLKLQSRSASVAVATIGQGHSTLTANYGSVTLVKLT